MLTDQKYTRLDYAFGRFLAERAELEGKQKQVFEQLVVKLSNFQNQGHSCITINDSDRELIMASHLAYCPEAENNMQFLPLVIEQNLLYTERYWFYEKRLARQLTKLSKITYAVSNPEAALNRFFFTDSNETDWQQEAAKTALGKAFTIITGGPGTGKTTTIIKILALLQEMHNKDLLMALAAPTGKAAKRLEESIRQGKASLPCSEHIKSLIPSTVTTLHSLLGARPPGLYFYHNADKPLIYDVIVVDEASMVDLALMSKLVDALKPDARLILLGDKNQLASVESGAVLADLTAALPANTLELKKSHRFNEHIKALSDAVNNQQDELAFEILQQNDSDTRFLDQDLINYITDKQKAWLKLMQSGAGFTEIYQSFNQFQVLCSNRTGKNSVADINHRVEQKLLELKLISPSSSWYAGRPIMVTQNNPALHLYNGDIGLCMPDSEQNGKLMVFFPDTSDGYKKHLPSRITSLETVYAMTIHKSQGSEFEEVLIVLPETINPLLSKELLYTAITRAKKTVKLFTEKSVFTATIRKKIERVTGLPLRF